MGAAGVTSIRKVSDASASDRNNFGAPGKFTQTLRKGLAKGDVVGECNCRFAAGSGNDAFQHLLSSGAAAISLKAGQIVEIPATDATVAYPNRSSVRRGALILALILGRLAIGRSSQKEDQS
jgi:hypothetical protein